MSPKWEHVTRLGAGGYGDVHLYKSGTVSRAVKFFKQQNQNVQSEIEKVKKLKHPNIVEAFDTPADFSVLEIVLFMEYTDRGSLRDEMGRHHCGFDELEVRKIVRDIARGVKFLHESEITHRDLKPENILVFHGSDSSVYKITDFGMAKDITPDESLVSVHVGTPCYWAPEQFDNFNNHKQKNDQMTSHKRTVDYWALGLICHECITGIRPYHVCNNVHSKEFTECFRKLREVKELAQPDDVICYTPGLKGQYVKSNTIAFPSRLCRTSLANFSKFLQIMLRYDKGTRGESNMAWSSYVEKITTCHMLIIYCVPTQAIFSYPNNQKTITNLTVRTIIEAMSKEAGLPKDKLVLMQWKNGEGTLLKPSASIKDYLCKFESTQTVEEGCLLLMLHNYRGDLPCTRSNQEECKELMEVATDHRLLKIDVRQEKDQMRRYKECAEFYAERKSTHCRRLTTALNGMAVYKKSKLQKLKELKLRLGHFVKEYQNYFEKYSGLAEAIKSRNDGIYNVIKEKVDEWRKNDEEHKAWQDELVKSIQRLEQLTSQWWTLPEEKFSICAKAKKTDNLGLISGEICRVGREYEGFVTKINEMMRVLAAILLPDDIERYIKELNQRLRQKQVDDPFQLIQNIVEQIVLPTQ